jgi:hypothetical protein
MNIHVNKASCHTPVIPVFLIESRWILRFRIRALSTLIILLCITRTIFADSLPVSLDGYDFDGDGASDALIPYGGYDELAPVIGRVDVLSGATNTVIRSFETGVENDGFGYSASTAGDLDGDGFNDIIIGAPFTTIDGVRAGRVYLYSGADGALLRMIEGDPGSFFGIVVAAAGDINGDGVPDIVVATCAESGESGGGLQYEVLAFDVMADVMFRQFFSPVPGAEFGLSVAAMGDLDRDGFGDIAIGDPSAAGEGEAAGAVYVFHGGAEDAIPAVLEASTADFVIYNSDVTLVFGLDMLPTIDGITGDVDGIAVFSATLDPASEPFVVSLHDWNGAVTEVRPFTRLFPVGDTNATQTVDVEDVGQVVEGFEAQIDPVAPFSPDVNRDGVVEASDLSLTIINVGEIGVIEDLAPLGAAYQSQRSTSLRCCVHALQYPYECIHNVGGACNGVEPNPGDGPENPDDLGGGGGPNGGGDGPGDNPGGGGPGPGGDGDDPPCAAVILGCPDEPVVLDCEVEAPPTVVWLNAGAGDVGFTYFWTLPAGVHFAEGTDAFDSWIAVAVDAPGEHRVSVLVQFPSVAQCTAVCVFEAILPCVDLDIDSDNNNGYDPPERSEEEDEAEDTIGDDSEPGRVILVNNALSDIDPFPDYADGYDWNPNTDLDNLCDECEFVPLVIDVQGVLDADAVVRLAYPDSDPLAIEVGSAGWEFVGGPLRIWSKNAWESRDPRPVHDGGDFIPSGEYTLSELGAAPGAPLTVYVEALRASETTADLVIHVELDAEGNGSVSASDQVRLTAVQVDLQILDPDDATTRFSPVLFTSNLYDADDPEQAEIADFIGAAIHHYRISDPRDLTEFTFLLGDDALSLSGSSGSWSTESFWIDSPPFFTNPGGEPDPALARRIVLSGEDAEWEYNPKNRVKRAKIPAPKGADAVFQRELNAVVAELEADTTGTWRASYPNDSDGSAFGKETHARVAARLNGRPGWISSAYFDTNTRELLSIGSAPPGGTTNRTEIDVIKVKSGQALNIGDVYDPAKIESVWEVKTSVNGTMTTGQKGRYRVITGGDKFKTAVPRRKYLSTGWIDHPTGGGLWKIQRTVTGVAVVSTIIAVSYPVDLEPFVDETIIAYEDLERDWDDPFQGPASAVIFGEKLGRLLSQKTGEDVTGMTTIISAYGHLYFQE